MRKHPWTQTRVQGLHEEEVGGSGWYREDKWQWKNAIKNKNKQLEKIL